MGDGVVTFCFGILVIIAPLTRKRQILQGGFATFFERKDMIERKGLCGKLLLTETIHA